MDHQGAIPISAVVRRHEKDLLALPGVVGVAEGANSGEPTIEVLVSHREAGVRIPTELNGYPVEIREVGGLHAH